MLGARREASGPAITSSRFKGSPPDRAQWLKSWLCLGRYGLPKRTIQPGMRVQGYDAALIADVKRLHAIEKIPRDLNGKLYIMCVQAVLDGDGDLPPDPLVLLPVNADDFVALAKRAGIERRYRYELYKRWISSDGA
jgi:hypothetical protein